MPRAGDRRNPAKPGAFVAGALGGRTVGRCGGSSRGSLLRRRLPAMSTTIRVSEATRDRFAELAKVTGRPMTELLDEAADALERRVFFDRLASRYAELRRDADAWEEIETERAEEAGSLADRSG